MKEIKLVHIVIAVILVLISLAMIQWAQLPRGTQPAPASSTGIDQPAELPVLPQNELYKSTAIPPLLENIPSADESPVENNDAPKDAVTASRKATL